MTTIDEHMMADNNMIAVCSKRRLIRSLNEVEGLLEQYDFVTFYTQSGEPLSPERSHIKIGTRIECIVPSEPFYANEIYEIVSFYASDVGYRYGVKDHNNDTWWMEDDMVIRHLGRPYAQFKIYEEKS